MGALRATLVRRHDSMTLSGIGVPSLAITSVPASCSSHRTETPEASMHILAASASSGPTPSPRISVTSCVISSPSPGRGSYLDVTPGAANSEVREELGGCEHRVNWYLGAAGCRQANPPRGISSSGAGSHLRPE